MVVVLSNEMMRMKKKKLNKAVVDPCLASHVLFLVSFFFIHLNTGLHAVTILLMDSTHLTILASNNIFP